MYIRYKLYRADMTTMFNAEMIEFVIENDDHLAMIDKIVSDTFMGSNITKSPKK